MMKKKEKSNIEIEEENNGDIDFVAAEAKDKDEKIEVLYDEEDLSNEEWLKIMQEKKLIDDLMNGKWHLLEIVNDDETAVPVETKRTILDNLEDDICEVNDALAVEQYE